MAWKNIQKEIDDFFAEVAKGVREELDSEYAHILEVNYKTAAIGFHNAASEIAGTDKYLGAKRGKLAIENILRDLCLEFKGNTAGLQPGQVFRSVKMTARGGGGIKKIGIPNVRVLEAMELFKRTVKKDVEEKVALQEQKKLAKKKLEEAAIKRQRAEASLRAKREAQKRKEEQLLEAKHSKFISRENAKRRSKRLEDNNDRVIDGNVANVPT